MPLPRVGVHRHFGLESRTHKSLASMVKIPRTSGPDDAEELIMPEAINFTESQGLKSAFPCPVLSRYTRAHRSLRSIRPSLVATTRSARHSAEPAALRPPQTT
jgi:hypothetical protein